MFDIRSAIWDFCFLSPHSCEGCGLRQVNYLKLWDCKLSVLLVKSWKSKKSGWMTVSCPDIWSKIALWKKIYMEKYCPQNQIMMWAGTFPLFKRYICHIKDGLNTNQRVQRCSNYLLRKIMFNVTIICKRAPKNVGSKTADNCFPVGDDQGCILGKNNLPKCLLEKFYWSTNAVSYPEAYKVARIERILVFQKLRKKDHWGHHYPPAEWLRETQILQNFEETFQSLLQIICGELSIGPVKLIAHLHSESQTLQEEMFTYVLRGWT